MIREGLVGTTTAERLAERLTAFFAELPEDEKALLFETLTQGTGEAEVSGYNYQTGLHNYPNMMGVLSNILASQSRTDNAVSQNIK
jgi:hypothetical protein